MYSYICICKYIYINIYTYINVFIGALRICADMPELKDNEIIVLEAFEKDDVPVTSYPAAKRQKHLDQQVMNIYIYIYIYMYIYL
jgi:hypothetical protein